MTSIDAAKQEVQARVQEALALAENASPASSAEFELQVWRALLALGRALMTLCFARQASRWTVGQSYTHEGQSFTVTSVSKRAVGTRFGKVALLQPEGRCPDCPRRKRDLPLQRELGLAGGFTLLMVTTMAKLCAQMAFAPARAIAKDFFGWTPSSRAVLRMVDATGEHARPFLEQVPSPVGDGEMLVVTVDAKGARAISRREHRRRTQPHARTDSSTARHARRHKRQARPKVSSRTRKKSKNAKMAVVGALYTLKRTESGELEGPINKRVFATFVSHRALFEWLVVEARKRGYGTSRIKKVLFVADGAKVLWSLQAEFFPDALQCLDWYHAIEKVWEVAGTLYPGHRHSRQQRYQRKEWVATQKQRLRRGQVHQLIEELETTLAQTPQTGPGNKHRRETLSSVLQYLVNNAERMQYDKLRRQDLDISSGVIEGAVRHLVGIRLDGPGMRWSRDRAESILLLRCIFINGHWDDFVTYLADQPDFCLKAQPVPTRTHDADIKCAA
jgi:hypothetical protein